jgi:hypothetical protein
MDNVFVVNQPDFEFSHRQTSDDYEVTWGVFPKDQLRIVIKLEDKKFSKPPTYEQAKAAIRNGLMQKKQFEFLSQLRQGANIVVR